MTGDLGHTIGDARKRHTTPPQTPSEWQAAYTTLTDALEAFAATLDPLMSHEGGGIGDQIRWIVEENPTPRTDGYHCDQCRRDERE